MICIFLHACIHILQNLQGLYFDHYLFQCEGLGSCFSCSLFPHNNRYETCIVKCLKSISKESTDVPIFPSYEMEIIQDSVHFGQEVLAVWTRDLFAEGKIDGI